MAHVKQFSERAPYARTVRRGDAPTAVLGAALELFTGNGYLATSIEDIAAAAGVARATVFTAVGPKPVILKTVVDRAMAGDPEPVPVAQRPWSLEAIHEPDPVRSLDLHARNLTQISSRVGLLLREVQTAARVDEDADRLWTALQQQRRTAMTAFARALAAKTSLRLPTSAVADTMWALAPDSYLRLVHEAGWSRKRYERWLADTMRSVFLP